MSMKPKRGLAKTTVCRLQSIYGFHVSVGEGMRADESRLKGPDLHVVQPRVMVDDVAFAG